MATVIQVLPYELKCHDGRISFRPQGLLSLVQDLDTQSDHCHALW